MQKNESSLSKLSELIRADLDHAPAVCVQHVSVFRGIEEVLLEIDFCLEEGDFLGVIGPNSGGKTTLLNLILGTVSPSEGIIEVFGQNPYSVNRRRIPIGYVPQYQLIPKHFPISVYETVLMGTYGVNGRWLPIKKEYKSQAHFLLAQLKLDHLMDESLDRLSFGEQQRVWLARALVLRPRMLLLDEPLQGLDALSQKRFFELLHDLKQQSELTVIMTSHNLDTMARFTNRIACVNKTLHWHDRSEWINHKLSNRYNRCELKNRLNTYREMKKWNNNPFRMSSDPSVHKHL